MFYNLTPHEISADEAELGVIDVTERRKLIELLTFRERPTEIEVWDRAREIARLLLREIDRAEQRGDCYRDDDHSVVIFGPAYLMGPLEKVISGINVRVYHPYYSLDSHGNASFEGYIPVTAHRIGAPLFG